MKKILLIFFLFGTLVFGETLVGKVVKVYDGDTMTMLVDGKKLKVEIFFSIFFNSKNFILKIL